MSMKIPGMMLVGTLELVLLTIPIISLECFPGLSHTVKEALRSIGQNLCHMKLMCSGAFSIMTSASIPQKSVFCVSSVQCLAEAASPCISSPPSLQLDLSSSQTGNQGFDGL